MSISSINLLLAWKEALEAFPSNWTCNLELMTMSGLIRRPTKLYRPERLNAKRAFLRSHPPLTTTLYCFSSEKDLDKEDVSTRCSKRIGNGQCPELSLLILGGVGNSRIQISILPTVTPILAGTNANSLVRFVTFSRLLMNANLIGKRLEFHWVVRVSERFRK